MQGIISISSKGTGYVKVPGLEEDPQIDFRHLNTALHGDTVEIVLYSRKRERPAGEVSKIVSRAKKGFSGVLEIENGIYFLKPDDQKMYTDILIPEGMLNGAKPGQKIYVAMAPWLDPLKAPEGKVVKILGQPGKNDTEMRAIAIEKGFDSDWPSKVKKEAEELKTRGIKKDDFIGRRDFRNIPTFTIDPENAKDFDDAISFRELNSGEYEIGVHIADVTHYVKTGSELDREAKKRGTSVYLVDRTIPMLPETLSNDLCSLRPGQDRLVMSAVFIMDKNARILKEWYGRAVIHSKKKFTYEEAEAVPKNNSAPFHRELAILNGLTKKLTKERFSRGAISLDQEEVRFILDKNGTPVKIIKKERGNTSRLVEEFMLLTNKKVAEKISSNIRKEKGVFIYRVHENPSKDKMADLILFLRGLGYKIFPQDGIVSNQQINSILENLKGKNEKDTVHRAVIRSMARAVYSTKNIGHYGLAFKHYTHFTSPIRRYPDIMVHRFLSDWLAHKKTAVEKLREYEKIGRTASEQEKRAQEAERASIKYKQVEYMSSRIGKTFQGILSGVTEWGIYVEETETKCEGMVRIQDLPGGSYVFDEKKIELVEQKTGKKYRLGDSIKIKVKNANLEKKTIDYVLAS